jgi:hypothetical protein
MTKRRFIFHSFQDEGGMNSPYELINLSPLVLLLHMVERGIGGGQTVYIM